MDFSGMIRKTLSSKFVKYVCVNGFTYSLLLALTYVLTEYAGIYYFHSYAVSLSLTIILSFVLTMKVIFKAKGKAGQRFIRYVLLIAVFYALNITLVKFITENMGLYYMLSIVSVTACTFVFKYLTYKRKVFQEDF
ncbi:MAG: GtrA family protein [Candidatus Altiarchaeota archaeon]